MARRRKAKAKARATASKTSKVKFFGHEILLTFVGSIVMGLGVLLATTGLQPLLLTWLLSSVVIWLGLLIFIYPIMRKIEDLM